eukprot:2701652-Rhodomonas_salina.2
MKRPTKDTSTPYAASLLHASQYRTLRQHCRSSTETVLRVQYCHTLRQYCRSSTAICCRALGRRAVPDSSSASITTRFPRPVLRNNPRPGMHIRAVSTGNFVARASLAHSLYQEKKAQYRCRIGVHACARRVSSRHVETHETRRDRARARARDRETHSQTDRQTDTQEREREREAGDLVRAPQSMPISPSKCTTTPCSLHA